MGFGTTLSFLYAAGVRVEKIILLWKTNFCYARNLLLMLSIQTTILQCRIIVKN